MYTSLKRTTTLFFLVTLLAFISCNKDDDQSIIMIVETEDLSLETPPFPMSGEVLGTVPGTTNHGNVAFEIITESATGAFAIDAQTGVLSVLDETLYDHNINPTITAQVKIANNNISAISNISVMIKSSNCVVSQQNFEDFVDDLINNQGYTMELGADHPTHEYTFSLSQSATICSIGYQGYDNTPYLCEIVDQSGTVIYTDNLYFSTTTQDYVSISPLSLAPGTYTIRRTKTNYTTSTELIGNIIYDSGSPLPFPLIYNSFMTFESSNYYDTGVPTPDNTSLPYISIAFH